MAIHPQLYTPLAIGLAASSHFGNFAGVTQQKKRGSFPGGVTRQDVLDALERYNASGPQGFGDSKDYDLLLPDGKRYPPKAIAGMAAQRVAGRVLSAPDFSAGEGQKCFKVLRNLGFVIVPKAIPSKADTGEDWSKGEVASAVRAYLEMRRLEANGEPFTKADFRRELRATDLAGRTESSIEFRMQNISATLADLGLPWISGYRPAKNVGPRVRALILETLAELSQSEFWPFVPTDDEEALEAATAAIRSGLKLTKPGGEKRPASKERTTVAYERSAAVRAFVLQEANGRCECCLKPAPFEDDYGNPFLEVHHVESLSEGGADAVENALAVCPNCHRRLHLARNREVVRKSLCLRIPRLQVSSDDSGSAIVVREFPRE